ncbi:MAG: DUF305 domain-containing protein [bacterium]|nr:DUF305 domain-containing protein [bacterium]
MKMMFAVLMVLMAAVVPARADSPVEGRSGRAEVRFLEGMIDHHQMALDMAQDCLAKAQTESIQTVCQNIIDTQSAEIELMRGWLLAWYNIDYAPMPMSEMMGMMGEGDDHSGHGGHNTDGPFTDPAMMMGMFAGFNRLEGVEYEIAWLESMIDHHDDALHMAERILRRAQHEEVITLANTILEVQTAEIEQMEALIAELGG